MLHLQNGKESYRCQGCQVVFYCGRDHQTSDWPQHKSTCTPTKKTRNKLASEVEILNAMPSDFAFTAKPFENSVGHFWGIIDTRDYMRARYAHVEALLKVKNRTAVQAALDHLLDMMRLNRSDNLGVRGLVPALYLRLQRDQECYDFLKWWHTSGSDGDYDLGNKDLPYLDIKDANAFEPLDELEPKFFNLSHCAMLCLLKWRLYFDVQAFDKARYAASGENLTKLLDRIRSNMCSSATQKNAALMQDVSDGKDLDGYLTQLESQLGTMLNSVDRLNKYYWGGVMEPGSHLTARPPHYSPGNVSEMQLSLAQTYDAWVETPGALEWFRGQLV